MENANNSSFPNAAFPQAISRTDLERVIALANRCEGSDPAIERVAAALEASIHSGRRSREITLTASHLSGIDL